MPPDYIFSFLAVLLTYFFSHSEYFLLLVQKGSKSTEKGTITAVESKEEEKQEKKFVFTVQNKNDVAKYIVAQSRYCKESSSVAVRVPASSLECKFLSYSIS